MSKETQRKVADLEVTIERDLCIGSGNCVKVAPDLFEMDDEDVAVFKANTDAVDRATVIEGCQVCPVEALVARDASGEKVFS